MFENCLRRSISAAQTYLDLVIMESELNMPAARCPRCDHVMRADIVKTAIWQGERLYVVEGIRAQVCDNCLEQYYDEAVTDALRRLTEEGFPTANATHEILVPVFDFSGVGIDVPVPEH